MRWPWEWVPWGRGRGADASDSAASPAAGSAVPASAEALPSAPDAASAAWSRLPPLQRTVADSTAVAPPAAFRAALTTHQNPSFLAPLGHLVDPDGPAGVVGGLASSVGGPISYEGVDELRVPERPAPPAAPAVQRRIASLRPEPSAVQRHEDAGTPTYGPGHDHHDPPETEHTEPEHIESGGPDVGEPVAGEPVAPETPVPAPLVVSRSIAASQPPLSGRPDADSTGSTGTGELGSGQAATLGVGESAVGATGGLGASSDAAVLPPAPAPPLTPLTVPVQRSVAPGESGSGSTAEPGRVGDLGPAATLRPLPAPPPSVAVPSPIQKAEAGPAAATAPDDPVGTLMSHPSPTATSDLVVARTAAEPVVRGADTPTSDDAPTPAGEDAVAGLLSSRPPIVESPLINAGPPGEVTTGDTAPLTVPSVGNLLGGSGPTLQRQFTDRPGATPSAASTPASPVVPSVVPSGVASMSAAHPDVPTAAVEPPRSSAAGHDDQGYPPLIARSVQRSTDGTPDAGRAPAPDVAAAQPAPDAPETSPQAPLSGFSAAISALHDSPIGAAPGTHGGYGGHGEDSADGPGESSPDPVLVVARLATPDQTGQLPVPEVRLQRTVGATRRLAPPSTLVQRRLIAGGSPLAAPPALGSATPAVSTPAVQRLRYEDVADPTRSHLIVDQRAGADDGHSTGGEHGGSTTELPTAPASAAWSPVALTPTTSAPASSRSGASLAAVQRAEAATSLPTVGRTTSSRGDEPPAPMLSPPTSGGDPAPMIQRRFDAPSPGTTVAPPTSVEPPAMAVSSRTVGLAEMFALAAARSSDGDATIQRSAETDVPPASDPPASTPATTGSAAPAGPAGPAAPPSGAELEEMARRLYEPLSARLRAELWQDRERSGLLTDLRP